MSEAPSAVVRAAEAFRLDAGLLRSMGGRSGSSWAIGDCVLRVGRRVGAEIAASSAAAAVVPVPRVLDRIEVGGSCAVLLERLPGRPAGELAVLRPDLAGAVGQACGAVHARLVGIPAPPRLRSVSGAGCDGEAGLLHLDLHPFNLLVNDGGELTGVLDWANAAVGDHMLDRARSWTILTLDPAARARRTNAGWLALTQEWIEAGALQHLPAAARTWACSFMLTDLARRYSPADMKHVTEALNQAQLDINPDAGPGFRARLPRPPSAIP